MTKQGLAPTLWAFHILVSEKLAYEVDGLADVAEGLDFGTHTCALQRATGRKMVCLAAKVSLSLIKPGKGHSKSDLYFDRAWRVG